MENLYRFSTYETGGVLGRKNEYSGEGWRRARKNGGGSRAKY
jgi:hypothetical protein